MDTHQWLLLVAGLAVLPAGSSAAAKPRRGAATRPTPTTRQPQRRGTTRPAAAGSKSKPAKASKTGAYKLKKSRGIRKAAKAGKALKFFPVGPCTNNVALNLGRGIYDITGPAAEAQMMGYANPDQNTAGIRMRLRSRAFVIESPCNNKRVVFVAADLGQLFQSVKQGVIDKLKKKYGNLYRDSNVILSATHTHHGPAGHSHYGLYNVTGLTGNAFKQGFDARNYNTIVNGIYKSIVRAHNSMRAGRIKKAGGDVANAGKQRSVAAYNRNPDRHQYATNTDRRMTLLRLETTGGGALGMINWFAVHPTSYGKGNRYITGDNKGIAAYWFERDLGTAYGSTDTFVGAFANANEGDVSPNLWGIPDGWHDHSRAQTIARRQYDKAKALYNGATQMLRGGVDFRHRYVDFSNRTVSGTFTGVGSRKTCPAALGIAFAAGSTEDGPGEDELLGVKLREGMPYNGKNRLVFPGTPKSWLDQLQPCHGEKDVLMPIGKKGWLGNPYPWTPEVLPVQLVTIGQLAIAAVPFECTTMCGRRIRKTIKEVLGTRVNEVVIAGLSNAYAGYVATREEYKAQHYEGASTHFGPWTLAALQQEFAHLARALKKGSSIGAGPTPRRLGHKQIEIPDGVVFDDKPIGKDFGDAATHPKLVYNRGQQAKAEFWSGHPKNNYKLQSSFITVQRRQGSSWVTVARDWDLATRYRWRRHGVANSKVKAYWDIPAGAAKGSYRFKHSGHWKSGWDHKIRSYSGYSRPFLVQ